MCGIAGLVERPDAARGILASMLQRIVHRGPDDEGAWVDEIHGVALGHRRLSIIDVSAAGHQPMRSARGRYVLTYNGEIYNFESLRQALERQGAAPHWRGHSDTEVLLAGFEAWGVEGTLTRCNGMFALALWDREERRLILARDRMGEKPLYFGWVGRCFAFSSELKAFTGMPDWQARMAADAIQSFLAAGYVRGPQSAVEGIYRLPPGCILTLSLDELRGTPLAWDGLSTRMAPFWRLPELGLQGTAAPLVNDDASMEQLETLLQDAVRLRMISDVPLGAFLSGGIDSSLVVALMQSQTTRSIRTFSIGFEETAFDEAPYARAVASHLGTDHRELYVGAAEGLALVPHLAATFDEPFADNSQIPTMLVSQLARTHVAVALSGDGGDELFAGYGRYFAILDLWQALHVLPAGMRRLAGQTLDAIARFGMAPTGMNTYRIQRLAERIRAGDIDALRLAYIGGGGMSRMLASPLTRDLTHCFPPPAVTDPLRRLMLGDQLDYLPDDILHKVDRASMAYGLEARVPLLDHRVVEYSWRLPTDSLVVADQGKQPLRRMLEKHVPRALVDRPKHGFAPPMDAWLRGPLRAWAESLLSEASLRDIPWLNTEGIRSVWRSHLQRKADAGTALWSILMLADWRQRFGATV